MTTNFKATFIITLVISLFLVSIGVSSATSGNWYTNPVSMAGNNTITWPSSQTRLTSYSTASSPSGVIGSIYADVRLNDRCRRADQSWEAWQQYGFNNRSATFANNSGTADTQGFYQNCTYGHQYDNKSYHSFVDSGFGINEGHFLIAP